MATKDRVGIEDVAVYFVRLFPKLNQFEQRLSIELYRLLSEGRPVPRPRLAQRLDCAVDTVDKILERWPGVFSDERRQVVGYWGLSIPTAYAGPHKIIVGEQNLSAWCAWDTLFLPQLLGQTVEIESRTPENSRVLLRVTPDRVEHKYPIDMQMSFLLPDSVAVEKDVLGAFCHFVHFFQSRELGQNWITRHPGTFLLTIDESYQLARRKNEMQYPETLGSKQEDASAKNGLVES